MARDPAGGYETANVSELASALTKASRRPRLPMADNLSAGALIAERYRVVSILGTGGMGVVYRVRDEVLDIDLALKMLRPEYAADPGFHERFRNELLTARQVTHPNVVRNHDIGQYEGPDGYTYFFLTMDFVDGESLEDSLDQGPLDFEAALKILRQIAGALSEAHRRGVVHRDLKPANILVDQAGDAFVTDFGIARSSHSAGLTRTGELVGTPHYLSPEQARGEKVDHRSDLYALGLIFLEMLSGRAPASGTTLHEVLALRMQGKLPSFNDLGIRLPLPVLGPVNKLLATEPEDRYDNAEAFLNDLDVEQRRHWLWPAVAVVVTLVIAVAVDIYQERRGFGDLGEESVELAADGTIAARAPARYAVAVLPLTASDELQWASSALVEMLSERLAEDEELRVVPSLRTAQVLDDLGFVPGQLGARELQQLADFLRVDRLVMGDLRTAGDSFQVELRLLSELDGGQPRTIGSVDGPLDDLFIRSASLVDDVHEALEGRKLAGSPVLSNSPEALRAYGEGLAALARGEPLAAAPALEQAVAADAGFGTAWIRLSKAYQDLGRRDEAIDAAKRATQLDLEGRAAYEARARLALAEGDPSAARQYLAELTAAYPNDAVAWTALGEAYGEEGDFAAAVMNLERAVELDAGEPHAWYLLGRYAIMAGDLERAVGEHLVQALALHTALGNEQGQGDVHNAMGVGYDYLGMLDEALSSYNRAAEIRRRIGDQRGVASTLINVGYVEMIRGDTSAAEAAFEDALEIHTELGNDPGIALVTHIFGGLEEERGAYAAALERYQRALRLRDSLGDEHAQAQSYSHVGNVFRLLGQYGNADLYLEKALTLYRENDDPDGQAYSLAALGYSLIEQGDWPRAAAVLLEALELARELGFKDREAVARGGLGRVAFHQGRYTAALEAYTEALALVEELGDRANEIELRLWQAELFSELRMDERVQETLADLQASELSVQQLSVLDSLSGRLAAAERRLRQLEGVAVRLAVEARVAHEDPARLRRILNETDGLGLLPVHLKAAEDVTVAALASGDAATAKEILEDCLKAAERTGGYGRAYRLHTLHSQALDALGDPAGAAAVLGTAHEELSRIREGLEGELRQALDSLLEVRELLDGP